ncbi:MAG: hypothetical protein WCS52_00620 [bacterium]
MDHKAAKKIQMEAAEVARLHKENPLRQIADCLREATLIVMRKQSDEEKQVTIAAMRAEVRRLKATGMTVQEAQRAAARIIEERFRTKPRQ